MSGATPVSRVMWRETPLVLALDIGISSSRASLDDGRARRVPGVGVQLVYAPRTTEDGGAELDVDTLVARVGAAIDGVTEQMGRLTAVGAVATSSFGHSLLGVDAAGTAVTPVYLWMDARSRAEAALLRRKLDERVITRARDAFCTGATCR